MHATFPVARNAIPLDRLFQRLLGTNFPQPEGINGIEYCLIPTENKGQVSACRMLHVTWGKPYCCVWCRWCAMNQRTLTIALIVVEEKKMQISDTSAKRKINMNIRYLRNFLIINYPDISIWPTLKPKSNKWVTFLCCRVYHNISLLYTAMQSMQSTAQIHKWITHMPKKCNVADIDTYIIIKSNGYRKGLRSNISANIRSL